MGGQIVDATVIAARRPRLNGAEKETITGGGARELDAGAHPADRPRLSLDAEARPKARAVR
jgi:hypothetical protein